jgi:hypothetical protein
MILCTREKARRITKIRTSNAKRQGTDRTFGIFTSRAEAPSPLLSLILVITGRDCPGTSNQFRS